MDDTLTSPAMPEKVAAVYDAMPDAARARALDLRALVYQTAMAKDLAAPEETLKWGEPAYLPGKSGTTVRIAADQDGGCRLLVHCQTHLVETWRARFAGRLTFEGNRAVRVDPDMPLDRSALAACIADAFHYHKRG